MSQNLREFMYLDSLSVQSLLASMDIAVTEEEVEVQEEGETERTSGGFSGSLSIPWIGSGGGSVDVASSKTGSEMLETRKKINDQYLFSQLYTELENNNQITTIPEDKPDGNSGQIELESGDVVEINGDAKTDPLFRMLNVVSLFARIDQFDIDEQQILEAKKAIYGKQIGMMVDVEEDDWSYAMSIERKNLWVDDPQREFLGARPYSVLGRVEEIVPPKKEWDFLDILRIAGTIFSDDTLDSVRTVGRNFIGTIDGYEQEVPFPSLRGLSVQDMQEMDEPPTRDRTISVDIKDKEISVEGTALIIDPIAVYW
ncbi:hypothetical protein HTSR_0148 [Halodesulfurarchaeum formicicum]|uniref:Uncharacterized protein n=1 Tax=Halodesulfurarchaeum formicicum TaxID=1873524 RepID=A0A1D8S1X0_9EURY|nr:hypothetical protein [Halodesulfurarchaeum formicicum]AOW79355.1 hypothetical protein HTSR_0148 [Halodesulfurarchaeum formicicum]